MKDKIEEILKRENALDELEKFVKEELHRFLKEECPYFSLFRNIYNQYPPEISLSENCGEKKDFFNIWASNYPGGLQYSDVDYKCVFRMRPVSFEGFADYYTNSPEKIAAAVEQTKIQITKSLEEFIIQVLAQAAGCAITKSNPLKDITKADNPLCGITDIIVPTERLDEFLSQFDNPKSINVIDAKSLINDSLVKRLFKNKGNVILLFNRNSPIYAYFGGTDENNIIDIHLDKRSLYYGSISHKVEFSLAVFGDVIKAYTI